jgi:hypothetical protein
MSNFKYWMFGIGFSIYSLIVLAPASAQSSISDQRIECIKKFNAFYYSYQGGNLSSSAALAKAEQTCATQFNQNTERTQGFDRNDRWHENLGGSPEAISDCMRKLMYERKLVCTRVDGCSMIPQEGFAGWQTQNVRTGISEYAVVQACRNAR